MLFAHAIAGLIPVDNNQFNIFWFIGSVFPDIDHFYVMAKHKIFKWKKIVGSMEDEKRYHIHYRTPLVHSFLGAFIFSLPFYYFGLMSWLFFFSAYITHLLLDWPDVGENYYLFPLKTKFKGPFPVFSIFEKIFTISLLTIVIALYLFRA